MDLLRVFLDTNILLDCALKRVQWHQPADFIIKASARAQFMKAYIASTSLKDVYYICTRSGNETYARAVVELLMQSCEIVDVTRATCEQALACEEPDFEDGIIAAAAHQCHADVILSRDADAFNHCGIMKTDSELFAEFFLSESPYRDQSGECWAAIHCE